ncbi:MAG: protein kinase, partial [Candidatus Riflebacteria bacterium]|nr:protein kinase [Candidatus Riflebacteria bacterium]
MARFRREVQACAALSHPNIVKILDFGENEEGLLYYTMELLVAKALDEIWQDRGAPAAEEVAALLSQAADALAYLHERGMVHRDIKPSNLMVDGRGRLFVMDFGVVKVGGLSGLTTTGHRVGTPRYMPPETVAGVEEGPAVDVYGLGLSFWELAAGRVAFTGTNRSALVAWIVKAGPPPLVEVRPGAPAWLSRLIERMLGHEPDDRPTAVEVRDTCRKAVGSISEAMTRGAVGPTGSPGAGPKAPEAVAPAPRDGRGRESLPRAPRTTRRGTKLARGLVRTVTRSFPLALLISLTATAAIAVLVWSMGTRPGPAALPHPDPSGTPGDPASAGVSFPRPGAARLPVPASMGAGQALVRLTVANRAMQELTVPVTDGHVELSPLDADALVRVEVVENRRGGAGSVVVFRTPRRPRLTNLGCWPSDGTLLVDLENPDGAPLEVEIGRWGDGAAIRRSGQPAGKTAYRQAFDGLSPGGDYWLGVRVPGLWGGIDRYRFHCLPQSHGKAVQGFVGSMGLDWTAFDLFSYDFYMAPDARVVAAAVQALRDPAVRISPERRAKLILALEVARSPDLADLCARLAVDDPDPLLRIRYLNLLGAVRDPRTVSTARRLLARHPRTPVEPVLEAVGKVPGAESFRFLSGYVDPLSSTIGGSLPALLVRTDRAAASRLALQLLGDSSRPCRSVCWNGIAMAELLGDEDAARALTPYLDREKAGDLHGVAVLAMTSMPRELATGPLLEAFARTPSEPPLALAAAHVPASRTVDLLTRQVRSDRSATRAASILALGLAGIGEPRPRDAWVLPPAGRGPADRETLAALEPLLDDESASVRDAAAWALGRRAGCGQVDRLRRFALSDRDSSGRGALALAEADDRPSAPHLVGLLDRIKENRDVATRYRAGMVALAIGRLRHSSARPLLAWLAANSDGDSFPQFAARDALRTVDERDPGDVRTTWLDPVTPIERTGIWLEQGQSVEIRVGGYWGWGGFDSVTTSPGGFSPSSELRPTLRVAARVGGRTYTMRAAWSRILADRSGELVLTTTPEVHRFAPGA